MKRKVQVRLVGLFLAIIMAVMTPLQVSANGQASGPKKYVRELLLVERGKLSSYQNNADYKVYETPIYQNENTDAKDTAETELFLVAELTADAADAITDIRALQMNDPYSFEEFKSYLTSLRNSAAARANEWLSGPVKQFRALYAAGRTAAKSAYMLLNCFLYDDGEFVSKNGGTPMGLGDLFLSETLLTKELLVTIIVEGNVDAVSVIEKALAMACAYDKDGKTFVDFANDEDFNDAAFEGQGTPLQNFSETAAVMIDGLENFRKAIKVYRDNEEKYNKAKAEGKLEAFDDGLMKADYGNAETSEQLMDIYIANKLGNSYELFYTGKEYVTLFGDKMLKTLHIPGPSRKYEISVLDFLLGENYYPRSYKKTKQPVSELMLEQMEYLLSAMKAQGSDGCVHVGIAKLFSVAFSNEDEYEKRIKELQNDEDEAVAKYAKEGISVFYGVNRDIFKDGMVAMTKAAYDENKTGDSSWAAKQAEYAENAARNNASYRIMAIASGAVGAASAACFAGYIAYTVKNYAVSAVGQSIGIDWSRLGASSRLKMLYSNNFVSAATGDEVEVIAAFGENEVRSAGVVACGYISTLMFLISLGTLGYSLYMYFHNQSAPILTEAYTEVPAIICDNRIVSTMDPKTREVISSTRYIYYNGVKNPDPVAAKSLYPVTDNPPKDAYALPENKGNVQDIYNWELLGPRQWLCLYETKDSWAGMPILADSLSLDLSVEMSGKATVKQFQPGASAFNLNSTFNACFINLESAKMIPDANKYTKATRYLHYSMDATAAGAGGAGTRFIRLLGSMVSSPAGWVFGGIFLAAGVGIGIVVCKAGEKNKARKKKETVA